MSDEEEDKDVGEDVQADSKINMEDTTSETGKTKNKLARKDQKVFIICTNLLRHAMFMQL